MIDKFDLSKLIGGADACALPEQFKPIIQGILEGRIKQFAIIAELEDGSFLDCFPQLQDDANLYAMIGALECLKRDFMRCNVQSRIEYEERE